MVGMNSVINPGVKLGACTIVTAGNKSQKAFLKVIALSQVSL